jgi:hypothetical protein
VHSLPKPEGAGNCNPAASLVGRRPANDKEIQRDLIVSEQAADSTFARTLAKITSEYVRMVTRMT